MKGMFQTLVNCGSLLETFLKQHDTSGPIDIKHAFGKYLLEIEIINNYSKCTDDVK